MQLVCLRFPHGDRGTGDRIRVPKTRIVSPLMPINCLVNQRDKEAKRRRDEEPKSQRVKETKSQRDKETKGQRVKEIKRKRGKDKLLCLQRETAHYGLIRRK